MIKSTQNTFHRNCGKPTVCGCLQMSGSRYFREYFFGKRTFRDSGGHSCRKTEIDPSGVKETPSIAHFPTARFARSSYLAPLKHVKSHMILKRGRKLSLASAFHTLTLKGETGKTKKRLILKKARSRSRKIWNSLIVLLILISLTMARIFNSALIS